MTAAVAVTILFFSLIGGLFLWKGQPSEKAALELAKEKGTITPVWAQSCHKCFKPVSARKGAKPYLTARTAVGMLQSIYSVYRIPGNMSTYLHWLHDFFDGWASFCRNFHFITCLLKWPSGSLHQVLDSFRHFSSFRISLEALYIVSTPSFSVL